MSEIGDIRQRLEYDWNDWVITDGEAGEAADIIMRSSDPQALVNQLKPQELTRLAENLPDHKRDAFLNAMAGKLDGAALAKLVPAFGRGNVTTAVTAHANPQTQAAYQAALPPATTGPQPSPSPGISPSPPPPATPPRGLTASEIALARKVFGDSIDYSKVRIHDGKYLPFQADDVAMTPNGNIYWPADSGDMSTSNPQLFIHEMTHVYQHQHGLPVLREGTILQVAKYGTFSQYNPYAYTYEPGKPFACYNIEQQGDIARDIYLGRIPNIIPQGRNDSLVCSVPGPSPGPSPIPPPGGQTSHPSPGVPQPSPGPSASPP